MSWRRWGAKPRTVYASNRPATAGRVLIDQGAGVDPAWTAVSQEVSLSSAGAAMVLPANRFLYGLRTGAMIGNMPPWAPATHHSPGLVSGTLRVLTVYGFKGQTITNLSFCSGNVAFTPGATPHWWFALYDSGKNLLKQTADQTSTAWAANTVKTVALSSAQLLSATDVYYIAIMVAGTTPPSMVGYTTNAVTIPLWTYPFGNTSDTGLTTTAPNPFGTVSTGATPIMTWCEGS